MEPSRCLFARDDQVSELNWEVLQQILDEVKDTSEQITKRIEAALSLLNSDGQDDGVDSHSAAAGKTLASS
ncbi:hypothetical protein AYO40_06920 [Planctomycetaceae bacterium SCGC AG-212-D15]|nr:hypothetical protein AYO40_06920 [Planctomycetaceae bacterium SCGC AG-212-D15]